VTHNLLGELMNPPTPNPTPTTADPLIDELRAIRLKISAEHGDDVGRLVEHLRQVERARAGRVVQPADVRRHTGNSGNGATDTTAA
jgi:hypothetical protein